jgi:hypothetical protein
MKLKTRTLVGLITLSLFLLFQQASTIEAAMATCTGKTPCRACKNCHYCGFCAKKGGTCGVCKRR